MSTRTRAILALVIASVFWGTAAVSAKILVNGVDPFVASFYRFLIATLIILPFVWKQFTRKTTWKILIPLSCIGALNVPLFYLGIQSTTANSATLIYSVTPLATMLFASIFIKEIHSVQKVIGILIGFIGALLIILLPLIGTNQMVGGNFLGNISITAAMLIWTLYTISMKRIHTDDTFSPLTITSAYFFASTFISLLFALISRATFITPTLTTPLYMGTLLYSSTFITILTYFLYQWSIKRISVTTASLRQYIELVVAVILNTILLGESMSGGFIIGTILVLVGILVATGSRLFSILKEKLHL